MSDELRPSNPTRIPACETVGHWSNGSISIHLDVDCETHRAWVLAQRPDSAPTWQPNAEVLARYQRCAQRIWEMFQDDPIPTDDKAQWWIERLEAMLDRGLLGPRPSAATLVVDGVNLGAIQAMTIGGRRYVPEDTLNKGEAPAAHMAKLERCLEYVREVAEEDCSYGDDCPVFGSRHGRCESCKARDVLTNDARSASPCASDPLGPMENVVQLAESLAESTNAMLDAAGIERPRPSEVPPPDSYGHHRCSGEAKPGMLVDDLPEILSLLGGATRQPELSILEKVRWLVKQNETGWRLNNELEACVRRSEAARPDLDALNRLAANAVTMTVHGITVRVVNSADCNALERILEKDRERASAEASHEVQTLEDENAHLRDFLDDLRRLARVVVDAAPTSREALRIALIDLRDELDRHDRRCRESATPKQPLPADPTAKFCATCNEPHMHQTDHPFTPKVAPNACKADPVGDVLDELIGEDAARSCLVCGSHHDLDHVEYDGDTSCVVSKLLVHRRSSDSSGDDCPHGRMVSSGEGCATCAPSALTAWCEASDHFWHLARHKPAAVTELAALLADARAKTIEACAAWLETRKYGDPYEAKARARMLREAMLPAAPFTRPDPKP